MARERMVTRTVESTIAHTMCLNVETADVSVETYRVSGKFEEKELLKKLKKLYETETFKVVAIQSTETEEKLYGMTEELFIELAHELPPRNL